MSLAACSKNHAMLSESLDFSDSYGAETVSGPASDPLTSASSPPCRSSAPNSCRCAACVDVPPSSCSALPSPPRELLSSAAATGSAVVRWSWPPRSPPFSLCWQEVVALWHRCPCAQGAFPFRST